MPYIITLLQLCFFLVQGSEPVIRHHGLSYTGLLRTPVISTADVAYQERSCNLPTLHLLLRVAFWRTIGQNLPRELSNLIIDLMDLGMSRENVEKHRRALMEDRKFGKHMGKVRCIQSISANTWLTDILLGNMGIFLLALRALRRWRQAPGSSHICLSGENPV
jgi:hypothetical protein